MLVGQAPTYSNFSISPVGHLLIICSARRFSTTSLTSEFANPMGLFRAACANGSVRHGTDDNQALDRVTHRFGEPEQVEQIKERF